MYFQVHLRLGVCTLAKRRLPRHVALRAVAADQNYYCSTTGGSATELARAPPDHRCVMTTRIGGYHIRCTSIGLGVITRLFNDPAIDQLVERITGRRPKLSSR